MEINENQKKILLGAIVVMALMLLFPPFIHPASRTYLGYFFIVSGPPRIYSARVDAVLLLVQWVGVFLISGLAFVALAQKVKK